MDVDKRTYRQISSHEEGRKKGKRKKKIKETQLINYRGTSSIKQ